MSAELREDLELAMMPLLDGSPAGPLLASRVKREVQDVLRKRGLQADVQTTQGGMRVSIRIRRGATVQHIGLDLSHL